MNSPNTPPLEELLSAYFDGEVSAQERLRVEQSLAESENLRSLLTEYGDLRDTLKSLAPSSPLGDLRASILCQLESPALAASERLRSRPPKMRRWMMWSLAASLAVVVAVPLVSLRNIQAPRGDFTTNSAAPQSPMPLEPVTAPAGVAMLDAPTADSAGPDIAMSFPAAKPALGAVTRMAVPQESALPAPGSLSFSKQEYLFREGRTPTSGELLSYLDTVGEQPVVVTYTVVDVVEAFDDVQVLLQREGIRALDGSPVPLELRSSEGTVAIYLEAPATQVDAVLNEIPVVFEDPETTPEKVVGRGVQAGDELGAAFPPPVPLPVRPLSGRTESEQFSEIMLDFVQQRQVTDRFQMVLPYEEEQDPAAESQRNRDPVEAFQAKAAVETPARGVMRDHGSAEAAPARSSRKAALIILKKDAN